MSSIGVDEYHGLFGKVNNDPIISFEFLVVAVFQPGMSWKVAASKIPVFKQVFANFDYHKVAQFDDPELEEIESNSDMIQNGRKIRAVLNNAQAAVSLEPEFGNLAEYFWSFDPKKRPELDPSQIGSVVAKDMKKRGFKFVGPTTIQLLLIGQGIVDRKYRP
ncbi:DNA-3-methyladenine glycosylase I [Lentilactobacillus sp. Marseille-Q4993]|uniref:DNA-3-methyladenine glycosylase I n=1 Tax=Lentilactobacillus sp. Marseille-Q4993 TaxID=3039492 RepID=UPI0024BD28F8|nr:DNA-3-methyladenine glycosylase I [Lentilactobacillus sp. Marseille-Q4993]